MNQRIKLIWDFKGPNASQTAAHHIIHLEEFSRSEKLENTLCGLENVHDMHHIAYLVVEKKHACCVCMMVIHTIKRPSPGWTPIPRFFNGLKKDAYICGSNSELLPDNLAR